MAVVHRVARLAQSAEQVASNENDTKHEHAVIQPGGHAAGQAGSCQLFGADAGRGNGIQLVFNFWRLMRGQLAAANAEAVCCG